MDDSVPLNYILSIASFPEIDFGFWFSIVVLLILLVASGLASGSEVAFFSLTPEEKGEVEEEHSSTSEMAIRLLNNPKDLLATILIVNNFVNVAIVILSSYIFDQIYPKDVDFEGVDYMRTLVEVVGITFILLLIGEVIPKVYSNRNSLKLVRIMAAPLSVIGRIPPFSWLRRLLVNGTEVILKYARKRQISVSTDDLENAIALTHEENITDDEQKILEGIVNFGNMDVRQVMRSRVDTVAVNNELTYEELMKVILESGYSRIPVYKETFDDVIGILFVKDLLPHLNASNDFDWAQIIRRPFFVPENKKIDDLLKEFQEKKMHMAVVVDEYGGSSGVITLEDVMEEIIGEITDEFDDDDIVYTKIDDSTYLFEGKTSLIDMYKILDVDGKAFEDEKGESDSIGGFLTEHAGKILKNNEFLLFNTLKFIVESSDKKRVKSVKIIKLENEDEEK